MPSKSQRAASRQARVRNRRKKGRPAPQTFQAAPTERRPEDEEAAAMAPSPAAATAGAAPSMTSTAPARPARRARRAEEAAAAEYPYMKPELIRIGAISSVVLLIIVGLTFVLG